MGLLTKASLAYCVALNTTSGVPTYTVAPALQPSGGGCEDYVERQSLDRGSQVARRGRAEEHDGLDDQHHHAEQRYPVAAEGGGRGRGAQIQEHPAEQHRDLEQERDGAVVPQTEPHLQRIVVQRQVGTVHDEVEHPMREHGDRDEQGGAMRRTEPADQPVGDRSEEHTSELQSPCNLVCRLLLEKKKKNNIIRLHIQRGDI